MLLTMIAWKFYKKSVSDHGSPAHPMFHPPGGLPMGKEFLEGHHKFIRLYSLARLFGSHRGSPSCTPALYDRRGRGRNRPMGSC